MKLLIILLIILLIEIPLCSWYFHSTIKGERQFMGEQEMAGEKYLIYKRVGE